MSYNTRSVVETLSQSELVQIDPHRDVVFETLPPHVVTHISHYFEDVGRVSESPPVSDSDSLFLTQSVAPVVRRVKRHQTLGRTVLPRGVESEDEGEGHHSQVNAPHQEACQGTLPGVRSDSESSDDDLVQKARALALRLNISGGSLRRSCVRRQVFATPTRTVFRFLQKSHSGRLTVHKNHILVNSEIGGFFKCIKKINKGYEESSRELCMSTYPFLRAEDGMDEDSEDDQDDIRKVDAGCFVSNTHWRNRQTWPPCEKWRNLRASKKYKGSCRRTIENDLNEMLFLQSRRKCSQIGNIRETRSSLSLPGSPNSRPIITAQEVVGEGQLDVLVRSSQSQSLDCGGDDPGQKVTAGCKNVETAALECETEIEEMQTPDSEEADVESHASETPESQTWDGAEYEELQETSEKTHCDPLDPEESGLQREDYMWSQDLFAEQENQADELMVSSSLKEVRVREHDEDLESGVVQNDHISLLGKKKNKKKPSQMLLDVVDRLLVDNAEFLRSSQSHVPKQHKITSPIIEIKQAKKEKHEKRRTDGTAASTCQEENVQFHHPQLSDVNPTDHLALADDPSASRVNVDSGFSQDIVDDIQGDNVETVENVFNYGGLSFLKKKKRKKPEVSKLSSSSTLLPPKTDQSKSFSSQADDSGSETVRTQRKHLVGEHNEGEKVKAASTLPKNSASVDVCRTLDVVQDSEVCTAEVSELKAKKKKKKDRDGPSLPQESERACVEEGVQMPHQTPHSLVSVTAGHKQMKVADLSSLRGPSDYVDLPRSRTETSSSQQCSSSEVHEEGGYVPDYSGGPTPLKKKKKKRKTIDNGLSLASEATEQFKIPEEVQGSEQLGAEVIPDAKVKKKNKKHRSTCQDTEVRRDEEETPHTASDHLDLQSSGAETTINQQCSSSEVHEEGGYGPDYSGGPTQLKKKKKKRKTIDNGLSLASDGLDTVEANQVDLCYEHRPVKKDRTRILDGPRQHEESAESADADGSKKKRRSAALCSDIEGSQSTSQTDGLHQPKRAKKKKNQSEADRTVTSETIPQKKRKTMDTWENIDSIQNVRPGLAKERKMVENPREVSVTQRSEGSVASTSSELYQNIEKKKKKKKKQQVVEENVEDDQVEATKQFKIPEEVQGSEQLGAEVIPDTKVKKKKKKHRSTCQDTEVRRDEEETPHTASDHLDLQSSGAEMTISQQCSSSEVHEEGGYGPDYSGRPTQLKKKKKKRKTIDNGLSLASDGLDTVEANQVHLCCEHRPVKKDRTRILDGPRQHEESAESADVDSSKEKRRSAALCSDAEGSQSTSQTEGFHQPKRAKKKKNQSEADRTVTSETIPQKKRKMKETWEDIDSIQNMRPGLAKELKMVENPREVSVTQRSEGSVASTSSELYQNIEKKKKKKKKQQVVEENVEDDQVEATEQFKIPEEVQRSEQLSAEVILDTEVTKKKKKNKKHRSTCQDTEVRRDEEETPHTASDHLDLQSSGAETTINQQCSSSEVHEEGGYGPDYSGRPTPLKKKKKKRKTIVNGLSLTSDGLDTVEANQVHLCCEHRPVKKDRTRILGGPRQHEESAESADADSSKEKRRSAALCSDAEGSQSTLQTDGLHQPKRAKKKKKRRSEADRNMDGNLYGNDGT